MEPDRIQPGPGQESVWDYPRPPRLEPAGAHLVVEFGGQVVAETSAGLRVLETSQAPAYYFPPDSIAPGVLTPSLQRTFCEWKGQAAYADLVVGDQRSINAAWCYPTPVPAFHLIAGWWAFYPGRVDRCVVDGEVVVPGPGEFYGGWITSRIVGPFKGGPGTATW